MFKKIKQLKPQIVTARSINDTMHLYYKPLTDEEAQNLARMISSSTSKDFFIILLTAEMPILQAKFDSFREFIGLINSLAYINHERLLESANTWLPEKSLKKEQQEINSIFSKENSLFKSNNQGALGCEPPSGSIIDSRGRTIVP